jgi:hypothetical protein
VKAPELVPVQRRRQRFAHEALRTQNKQKSRYEAVREVGKFCRGDERRTGAKSAGRPAHRSDTTELSHSYLCYFIGISISLCLSLYVHFFRIRMQAAWLAIGSIRSYIHNTCMIGTQTRVLRYNAEWHVTKLTDIVTFGQERQLEHPHFNSWKQFLSVTDHWLRATVSRMDQSFP